MKSFSLKRLALVVFCCTITIVIILKAPQFLDTKEILQFNRNLENYNVKLQIIDANDKKIAEFSVALADDDYKKMYGLMNLNHLPKQYGMLFTFSSEEILAMWMKNTRIPLDMLFIDKNDVIVNIKTNNTPYSLEIISSEKKTKKVLEINGNLVGKLGIKIGQKIKII